MWWFSLWFACVPPDPEAARASWLRDALVTDNNIWLGRDHILLAGKYRRMRDDPYDYMRGTFGVFLLDVARPDPDRAPTQFLHEPDAARVLLAGDPHPENFGTTLAGPEPRIGEGDPDAALGLEAVDLDGAAFGPYLVDVRRAALGLVVLLDAIPDCAEGVCIEGVIGALADGYVDEIQALAKGEPGWESRDEDEDGEVLRELREEARDDGLAGARLSSYTTVTEEGRRFMLDLTLDETGSGVLAATDAERDQALRLLNSWTRRPAGFRVLDVARRYGAGVASFPAIRLVVAWDQGDPAPEDDALLALREVIDPAAPPGRTASVPSIFASNAARIEEAAWMLWATRDADVRLAGLTDGGLTFKSTTWSGWFQGLNHLDVAEQVAAGDYDEDDLEALGRVLGHRLAAMHARAPVANGQPALQAIAADLGDDDALFEAERIADARHDRAQLVADHALFGGLLDQYGPLLGATVAVADTPR